MRFVRVLCLLCLPVLLRVNASEYGQRDAPAYTNPNLSPEARAKDIVSRMTLAEKVSQMQNAAPAIPRLNIPAYDWWNEALHGVARAGLATVFPQAIGLAATWDTNLEHEMATAISTEARAKYNDAIAHDVHKRYYGLTFWSPNINIFRDPRWGRGQETYGEDPYLTGAMAAQFITGMQGDDPRYLKTIATAKHFAVHSGPERLRHTFDAQISDEDLENTYLPAFRQSVEQAGVRSIMCVYNEVDGAPGCASDLLLKKTLRGSWNFAGYVVSDCGAVDDIFRTHHFTQSIAEASALAVVAGTDLECGTSYRTLVDAVHQGLLTEADIDRSVERLFAARFRLGMFDPPERVPFVRIGMDQVANEAHAQLALKAAEESIVLLKNDQKLLPLADPPRSIAVIGPAADDPDGLLGNYNGIPPHTVTPLAGIEAEFSAQSSVRYALGASYVAGWTSLVPENVLTPAGASNRHGLRVEYFANETYSGVPKLDRVEPRVYFNWEMGDPAVTHALPKDGFSVRWTGALKVNQAGAYQLGLTRPECHDCGRVDTARLYIDGKLVVDDARPAGEEMFSTKKPVHFEAGRAYQVRVEYKQHGGGGGLELVWTPPADAALRDATNLATKSDLIILCVGLNSRLEGEESRLKIPGFDGGDRTDLRLPEPQRALVQAVWATGKPVIAVLANGSALAVPELQAHAAAIIEAWYGGQEGGTALARTLSGKNNPAGRLPVTFYASVDQLPPFTDYSMHNRTYRFFNGKPLYPFGYGLSYSSFRYSDLQVGSLNGDTEQVEARVTNKSERDGDEVAELYLSDGDGAHPQLAGFTRLHLRAGETQTVRFRIKTSASSGRLVSVGSGQPLKEWTGDAFVQTSLH